jgi:anthranilate phosphoribosyltransferase
MAQLLWLCLILDVRNPIHTVVKIMQQCDGPALRLVSYIHPEYLAMLSYCFTTEAPGRRRDAVLMRGTEGETVANTKRLEQIE